MIFVDANYFLRFILQDNKDQYQISRILFQRAALGEIELFTSSIVLIELNYVLCSFYGMKLKETANIMNRIFQIKGLTIENRDIWIEGLSYYLKGVNKLEDCLHLAYMSAYHFDQFATFDRKLQSQFQRLKQGNN